MQSLSPSQRHSLALLVNKFQEELRTEPDGQSLLDYLVQDRGISEQSIDEFRLGAVLRPEDCDPANGGEPIMLGRIAIPFLTPTGAMAIRYMQPPPRGNTKYWQPEGSRLGIYNTTAITIGGPSIAIIEGEMDTIIASQIGIPAVGMPGAGSWKDHYHAIFDGYEEVVIIGDNDETPKPNEDGTVPLMASERFVRKVADRVPNPRIIMMPRGHDLNSAYCEFGPDFVRDLIKIRKGWL